MDDRTPKGVLLVFTNCSDPAREEDFNRWYNEVCIPGVVSAGTFSRGSRWMDARSKPAGYKHMGGYRFLGGYNYLAIYETDKDPALVQAQLLQRKIKLGEQGEGAHSALAEIKPLFYAHLMSASRPGETIAGRKCRGAMLVLADCVDPALEADFKRWYDEHAHHMVTLGYYTASRWANPNPWPGNRKYLAIYETEDDPTELFKNQSAGLDKTEGEKEKGLRRAPHPGLDNAIHWLYRRMPGPRA